MTIDELDRIVCQALAAEGRLCLTVHDGAADLEADGLFAKVDDGLASCTILAHMAYMVNEMVERIVGADALGFSRLVGAGTNGHDAHVDFFADVCKLLEADRSAVPAFERLYAGWYHSHLDAGERLDEALKENEALKAQCQTLEEALAFLGGTGSRS